MGDPQGWQESLRRCKNLELGFIRDTRLFVDGHEEGDLGMPSTPSPRSVKDVAQQDWLLPPL